MSLLQSLPFRFVIILHCPCCTNFFIVIYGDNYIIIHSVSAVYMSIFSLLFRFHIQIHYPICWLIYIYIYITDTAEYGFTVYRDHNLEGMGRPHAIYVDVTSQVCRHICVKLKSESCCSVVYERATRTCYITPMDMKASGAKLVTKFNTDYFHRKMCVGR